MRVAVVHYHLKRGGVTRVIENTARALAAAGKAVEIAAVTGAPAAGSRVPRAAEVPGLGYSKAHDRIDPDALLHRLRQTAARLLGGPPDLWHIHNHSLGKNINMAGVVARLARSGEPVLFQVHDFAEDNRPRNYALVRSGGADREALYPVAPHIGYAVLNGRDRAFLRAAGVPGDRLFFLPNPVPRPEIPPRDHRDMRRALDPDGRHDAVVLYPVRATRRKNLGELALWAGLYSNDAYKPGAPWKAPLFVNTLGATNPAYEPRYRRWKAYGESERLPVRFGVAEDGVFPFEGLVAAADAIITTSVAEGFGLGFLEPWTFDKALIGRDIPEITRDFTANGIALDGLYRRIDVPLDWCGGRDTLRDHLLVHMRKVYRHYERELSPDDLDRATTCILKDDRVDFGRLDEALQCRVIDQLRDDPARARELEPDALPAPAPASTIADNREKIFRHYSTEAYADRLDGIYRTLAEASGATGGAVDFLDPARVLDPFLDPLRFNLLRT